MTIRNGQRSLAQLARRRLRDVSFGEANLVIAAPSLAGTSATMKMLPAYQRGLTLFELMAVVMIIGLMASIIMPRISSSRHDAAEKACYHNRMLLNAALERYALTTGGFPSDLSALNVPDYFPGGIPACPVSGNPYSLSGSTNRINGHAGGVHP